ncbi:ABC transporter permease [Amycolatopsis pigmentata]|uniref:ABC transporter permease n=1 Tax=Amycolatopsis pigmentata TaxID=450801 RepID=A0ABW5FW60_9PSEU
MGSMFSLAWQTIRGRRAGFVAAFIAVFFGSALITACGVLLDSGLRAGVPPQRYASAPVVVTAAQSPSGPHDLDTRFSERVPLPEARVGQVAQVPGVHAAVGDVSVNSGLRTPETTRPLVVHGWSSAQLGPVALADGRPPRVPGEVALDRGLGVHTGDVVDIETGAVAGRYQVVGTTATTDGAGTAFLTDAQARQLSGRPGQVDAIAVLADGGVTADELAKRINDALPGVVTSVGQDRAEAEFVDAGAARSFLLLMASSFGGAMLMIVLAVVASTLGLTIQQRRREFALLRAIAATPRQIYRLITAEATLVALVAAILGALPGIGVSLLLRAGLVHFGVLPNDFRFAIGPLPPLAAVAGCVLTAALAGLIAGRRAARISPVAALGEAAVEPRQLGRVRMITGWLLIPLGLAGGLVLPILAGGTAALGGAAGSALILVIAVALLGPRLLTGTAGLLGRAGLGRTVSGFLARANTFANSRRLATAATPLIMGVALASVQIFSVTTTTAAAQRQAETGVLADHVLAAQGGIAPGVADTLRRLPGVTATPVARTNVLVTHDELGDPTTESYPAQGITTDGLGKVLDLGVVDGDLNGLSGDTVAVSRLAADTFGVHVGETLAMYLGDGTAHTARVVAIYRAGLGFGDVTLPNDVVVAHTTSRLDDEILVSGADVGALHAALATHPEVRIADRTTYTAGRDTALAGESNVNLLINLVVLGFIAIAVVNILVLATAARVREFALLRLVGAKPRQVRSMMRGEAGIVVVASVVLGSLAALPPLIGISVSLTGTALPTVPPLAYLGVVVVAIVLGWGSIAFPTRSAMRPTPIDALSIGE